MVNPFLKQGRPRSRPVKRTSETVYLHHYTLGLLAHLLRRWLGWVPGVSPPNLRIYDRSPRDRSCVRVAPGLVVFTTGSIQVTLFLARRGLTSPHWKHLAWGSLWWSARRLSSTEFRASQSTSVARRRTCRRRRRRRR